MAAQSRGETCVIRAARWGVFAQGSRIFCGQRAILIASGLRCWNYLNTDADMSESSIALER
ncbi:MAG: hypothetical protein ACTSYX_12490, partial [Candidatus Thorarchaeota archaeon]